MEKGQKYAVIYNNGMTSILTYEGAKTLLNGHVELYYFVDNTGFKFPTSPSVIKSIDIAG